jgi:hypothetical protein
LSTSASVTSHKADKAFIEDIRCAKKAFAVNFDSEDQTLVLSICFGVNHNVHTHQLRFDRFLTAFSLFPTNQHPICIEQPQWQYLRLKNSGLIAPQNEPCCCTVQDGLQSFSSTNRQRRFRQ